MRRRTISVIIPTWNCARFLPAALDSVLAQSLAPDEVIVVDDGSTDDTQAVLAPYRDRIIAIKQANAGPAAARNAGIARASGDLIAFLDADDLWLPDKLEMQCRAFDTQPEPALVYARFVNFHETAGGPIHPDYVRVPSGFIFDDLLLDRFIALPTIVIKADVLRCCGGFDERLRTAEDTNLYLKVAWEHPILGLDAVLVRRRLHDANISARVDLHTGTLDNLDLIVAMHPETAPAVYPPMKQAYYRRGKQMMEDCFYGGNYRQCHEVCARLLGVRILRPRILCYWLMTLLPAPAVGLARRLKRSFT